MKIITRTNAEPMSLPGNNFGYNWRSRWRIVENGLSTSSLEPYTSHSISIQGQRRSFGNEYQSYSCKQ